MGPARSPAVLGIFSPCSAKADAHWLTACSLAPAQSIIVSRIQNRGREKSSFQFIFCWPSSIREAIGTRAKARLLQSGSAAQRRARIFQRSVPKKQKKRVERRTTPT